MKRNLLLVCLFILVTFPAYKALRHPGMITGHDTEAAMFKAEEFFGSLADGSFPPRWSKRLDFGLGQPTFTFTYSMPYYLTSMFMLLNTGAVWAVKIVFALSFPVSGFLAYLWLSRHFDIKAAVGGGILYAYLPYHMANVYVRGAIGETVAAMFLPLAFWGIDRVLAKPNAKNAAVSGILIALVILSHSFYGMIFSAIWAGYVLTTSRGDVQKIKYGLISLVWGYINCVFYIVPALIYKNLTYLAQIESYFLEKQGFVDLGRLIYSGWGFDGANELNKNPMSVQLGVVGLILFLAGALTLLRKHREKNEEPVVRFFVICVIGSIFMMLAPSFFIWKIITPLMALQFPWRLLFVANIGMVFCAAFVIDSWISRKFRGARGLLLVMIIAGLTVFTAKDYWGVQRYFPFEDKTITAIGYPGTLTLLLEETPKWHVPAQEANPHNFIQNANGNATSLAMIEWKTNYHKYETVAESEMYVNDKTHYWPGWKVWVDGKEVPLLDPYDPIAQGLITFAIPAGKHTVESRLTEPPVNAAGNTISAASLGIAGLMILLKRHEQAI